MISFGRGRRKKADRLLGRGNFKEAIELYEKGKAWDGLMVAYERRGDLMSAAEAARMSQRSAFVRR